MAEPAFIARLSATLSTKVVENKRNRRPHLDIDVARFGEDETVILLREGGWVRVYRSNSKADTMTTTGHVVKAMRDMNEELGLDDFVDAQVDEVGVIAGVLHRPVELNLPVACYNGGAAPIDKERFVNRSTV